MNIGKLLDDLVTTIGFRDVYMVIFRNWHHVREEINNTVTMWSSEHSTTGCILYVIYNNFAHVHLR